MSKLLQTTKKNSRKEWLLILFSAFLITLALTAKEEHPIDSILSIFRAFDGNSAVYLPVFFAMVCFVRLCLSKLEKRVALFSGIGGFIFATCQAIGDSLRYSGEILIGTSRISSFLFLLIRILGYALLYGLLILYVFAYFNKRNAQPLLAQPLLIKKGKTPSSTQKIAALLLGDNAASFWLRIVLIILLWRIYFAWYFPGILTADSRSQVNQFFGLSAMNNHHPVLHSLLLGGTVKLGMMLFGTLKAGVALFSIVQMLASACVFSAVVSFMKKIDLSSRYRLFVLLYAACFPICAFYSFTAWKDIPLALCVLMLVIYIAAIIKKGPSFFRSFWRTLSFVLILLGVTFFKNTGIYIVVSSLLVMFFAFKSIRIRLGSILLAVVALYGVITGPVYTAAGIAQGDAREALSVPILQISLAVKSNPDGISDKDRQLLSAVLPYDDIDTLYNSEVSDSLKEKFNTEIFQNNRAEYFSLWVSMGLQNPNAYVIAFLSHSYGYWYPDLQYWIVGRPYEEYIYDLHLNSPKKIEKQSTAAEDPFFEEVSPQISQRKSDTTDYILRTLRNIPLLSLPFSVGFYFWLLLTAALYALYQKKYKKLLVILPTFVVWLTCITSPVYAEFRYAWPAIICVPFILSYIFGESGQKKTEDDEKSPEAVD